MTDPLKLHCPQCHSIYWIEQTDEKFAHCEECGYEQYNEHTLAIIAEVKQEQANCKRVLGYIPSYKEAVEKGLAK